MQNQNKKNIIIIHDDDLIKKSFQSKLKDENYEILESNDFEGFIKLLRDDIDLIICEYNEVYTRSKIKEEEKYKNIPLLFIIKDGFELNADELLKEGAEDTINLSGDLNELPAKVQALLRRSDILKTFGNKVGVEKNFVKDANKVLLVDDDVLLIRLFEYNLTKAGFEVKSANNGFQALDAIKAFQPDIIVSDIMMPDMDGFELRKNILKEPELKSIPFVFLTAKGDEQDILEGYDLEVEDYIIKTSGPRILVAKVSAILKSLDRERKKLVSEIHQAADSLRAKVVPDNNPAFEGFEIKHWHQPFKGIPGGDFIDYFNLNDDNLAIVLGDVMGKKWGAWYFAFAYAGYVRSAIRVVLQSAEEFPPSQILQKVNESIYQDAKVSEVFATLSVVVINKKTKVAQYAGAGDLPLIYKNTCAGKVEQQQSKGLLLGFSANGNYDDVTINLNSNDCIFLTTDGIIESRIAGGEQFGSDRLEKLIANIKPDEDPLEIIKDAFTQATGGNFEDDISLISIKVC